MGTIIDRRKRLNPIDFEFRNEPHRRHYILYCEDENAEQYEIEIVCTDFIREEKIQELLEILI